MQGKTILITGATDGIGRVTARQLADMDARVIVHGRSAEKAAEVKDTIITETGNDKVETAIADLSVMANVRALASEITDRFDHLDVLINNAGVYLTEHIETSDGFEKTFAVNHLAPFLLTNLLLPLLKASAPARVITVSSVAHGSARVDLDNLNAEKRFHGWGAYCLSKLGNLLFTFELARRLEGSGVTANALHPGTVNTKMLEKLGMQGKPVTEGAATSVFLASSQDVAGVTGKYFSQKRIAKPSDVELDRDLQQKFWDRSAEMVNLGA
ncbi:SDR family oxidoreductase [bacterium]|nr:SDR family oxidoreductase [bacterium]